MTTLPTSTLLRFRDGDPDAFAEVMRAYAPLARAVVAKHWKSAYEQEEAMQELWVHVFHQRAALDPARLESFPGFLAILMRRRSLDLLRRPAEPLASEEEELAALVAPAPQQDDLEAKELRAACEAFRVRLRPPWGDFFQLHFVEGLAYEEIARRMRVTRLRCKYMKKVLAQRARGDGALLAALGRYLGKGGVDAS